MSTTTTRPCRAKNPGACRIHGTANVTELFLTWINGDMEDNDGRWSRAKAYMDAAAQWQCQEPIRVSSMSHDSGMETLPCRLPKNHAGEHDPHAKEPWQDKRPVRLTQRTR